MVFINKLNFTSIQHLINMFELVGAQKVFFLTFISFPENGSFIDLLFSFSAIVPFIILLLSFFCVVRERELLHIFFLGGLFFCEFINTILKSAIKEMRPQGS